MLRYTLPLLFTLGLASSAMAQTQVPSPIPATYTLAWDHNRVNTDGFRVYVDNVAITTPAPTLLYGITWGIPFPALTPGSHTITVAAYNAGGESDHSVPLPVVVTVTRPQPPQYLQIIIAPAP